jgi:hypothetical protein
MNALRECVTPYIPYLNKNPKRRKNIRFHYADYKFRGGTLEDLKNVFNGSNILTYDKYLLKNTLDVQWSDYMKQSTVDLFLASLDPSVTASQLSIMAVDLFLKDVKDGYADAKKEDKFTRYGCDKYRDVFVECLTATLLNKTYPMKITTNFRLFVVYRFFMDMYSLCRVMRNEGNFYKNMIHYSGTVHTYNMRFMLVKLGFTEVQIDDLNTYDMRNPQSNI